MPRGVNLGKEATEGHCVEVRALTLALTDRCLPAVTVVPGV